MILDVVTTTLRHQVRLRNAGTGAVIRPLTATLEPPTPGWHVRAMPDGTVVVTAREDSPLPSAAPAVVLRVVDGVVLERLDLPAVDGRPPGTVLVPLTGPDLDIPVSPEPQRITIALTLPGSDDPAPGRSVRLRGSAPAPRPTVTLPETAPGVYVSPLQVWSPRFRPADLLVGDDLLRSIGLHPDAADMRLDLTDTT